MTLHQAQKNSKEKFTNLSNNFWFQPELWESDDIWCQFWWHAQHKAECHGNNTLEPRDKQWSIQLKKIWKEQVRHNLSVPKLKQQLQQPQG